MMEAASLAERIEKCEQILKENSQSQVFAALADAYRNKGDLDQAFRICRQGIRVHPNYGPGHLVMAKISFERKMFDWAEQELHEAVRIDGETRMTQQLRVEIQIAKGNFGDAEGAIKRLRATGVNPLTIQELQHRLDRQKKEERRRKVDQAPAVHSAGQGSTRESEPQPAARSSILTISEALDKLAAFSAVKCVLCANHDGTVVDSRGAAVQGCSEMAAFGLEMCRTAETEAALEVLGNPQQIWAETSDLIVVIVKTSRFALILGCNKDMNTGSMRLLIDEVTDRLRDS